MTFSLEKRPKNDSKIQRPIRVPEITKDCRAGTHLGSKIVPNSRERGQKSLKLMEWPEFPDDPPSESLRQRSSERKLRLMTPRSPQEKVLFFGCFEASSCNYPMDNRNKRWGCPPGRYFTQGVGGQSPEVALRGRFGVPAPKK